MYPNWVYKKFIIKFNNRSVSESQVVYTLLVFFQYFALSLTASNGTMYLLSRGISIQWIGYLGTIGGIAVLLFEFPTGVIADRLGSGTSIAVSLCVRGVAAFLALFCYGPFLFAIITIMNSVGATCYSGAAEAWIFGRDSSIKRNMAKFFSNTYFVSGASRIVGGLLGALVGSISLRIPFAIASAVFVLISVLFIFFDTSSEKKYSDKMKKPEKSIAHTLISGALSAFLFIKKEKDIFWFMLSGVFFIFFCSYQLFLGIIGPFRAKILNRRIADDSRASILSLISFSESVGSICSLSLFGYLSGIVSLDLIFGLSTVPLAISLMIAIMIAVRF